MKRTFLSCLPIVAILIYVGTVLAQVAVNSTDPCAIYPHQNVFIPQATATARAVAGIIGKAIYVCGVHCSQASPTAAVALTLSYGEGSNSGASPTPCATASPGGAANLAQFSGGTTAVQINDPGTDNTTMLTVPISLNTPVIDLCASMNFGNALNSCHITYVQR